MWKPFIFKCPNCDHEKEIWLDKNQYESYGDRSKKGHIKPECEKCGEDMIAFNWARHSRWRFMDND